VEGILNRVGDEEGGGKQDRPLHPLTGIRLKPVEGNKLGEDEESEEDKEEGEESEEEGSKGEGANEEEGSDEENEEGEGVNEEAEKRAGQEDDEDMQVDNVRNNENVPGSSFGGVGLENPEGGRTSDVEQNREGGDKEELQIEKDGDNQNVPESPLTEFGSQGAGNDDLHHLNVGTQEGADDQLPADRTQFPDCTKSPQRRNNHKGKNSKNKNSKKANKCSGTSQKAHPPIPIVRSARRQSQPVYSVTRVCNYSFSFQ